MSTAVDIAAVRKALADVPAVTGVECDEEERGYYVTIREYDPSVTYAIAKRLAGMGVYYHVVPASVES